MWIIYSLSLIIKQRRASPVQSALDITAQLNATAHRTKPAFAAFLELRGFFTPFHTYL